MLRVLWRNRISSAWQQTTLFSQNPSGTSDSERNEKREHHRRHHQQNRRNNKHGHGSSSRGFREKWESAFRDTFTLLAIGIPGIPWLVSIKDFLGIEKFELDRDSLKNKIKQAMLMRSHNQFDKALEYLQNALEEAKTTNVEAHVTRVYNEIANTYYEMNELDKAFEMFRTVVQRLVRLHAKNESSPEFIGVSLKMADIFARRGDIENAEIGFKHCVSKQLLAVEEHQKNYLISKGAVIQDKTPPDTFGPSYTDPIALFGIALEAYAYFLLDNFREKRIIEAEEYMNEVLKISGHIYGSCSTHSVYLISNFAARCITHNQHKLARKYLELGLNRVLNINECEPLLVSYYCNYAEALFHTGDEALAVDYARKAELFSRSQDPKVQKYAENFLRHMEREARRCGVKPTCASADAKQNSGSWRSWIPI